MKDTQHAASDSQLSRATQGGVTLTYKQQALQNAKVAVVHAQQHQLAAQQAEIASAQGTAAMPALHPLTQARVVVDARHAAMDMRETHARPATGGADANTHAGVHPADVHGGVVSDTAQHAPEHVGEEGRVRAVLQALIQLNGAQSDVVRWVYPCMHVHMRPPVQAFPCCSTTTIEADVHTHVWMYALALTQLDNVHMTARMTQSISPLRCAHTVHHYSIHSLGMYEHCSLVKKALTLMQAHQN